MEALNNSITELRNMFNTRMTQFEEEMKKAPAPSPSVSSLTSEFNLFRQTIVQALTALQMQVDILAQSLDSMEMRNRRKMLLLHGVPENENEKTNEVVVRVLHNHFQLKATVADIKRCHRMGRSASNKPRPIVIKLHNADLRGDIWFNKTKLKGSGITVSEFLTKTRHKLFLAAREKFGVNRCWTREGLIFAIDSSGSRHRLTSLADFNKVGQRSQQGSEEVVYLSSQPASSMKTTTVSKTKRAAARK